MTTYIKLPGEKWWIEFDEVNNEVIGSHYKPQITADIQAINATLDLPEYPKPTQVDNDVADLLAACDSHWNDNKRARIKAMIQLMYQAYTGNNQRYVEAVQLIARRDALIILRDLLV